MIIFIIALIIIWIFVYFGATHYAYRDAIRYEIKRPKVQKTSNSKGLFTMSVDSCEIKTTHKLISGRIKGTSPVRGDVVYIDNNGDRKPVFVKGITTHADEEWEAGVYATLKVFGSGKLPYDDKAEITNKRNDVLTDSKIDNHEIAFPVSIKPHIKDLLVPLYMLIIGIFCIGLGLGMKSAPFMAVAVIVTFTGGVMLFTNITNRMVFIDEKHVSIQKGLKKYDFHMYNLNYRMERDPLNARRLVMKIYDNGNTAMGSVSETHKYFTDALYIFRNMVKERSLDKVARMISSKQFLVPTDLLQKNEQNNSDVTMIQILTNTQTEKKRICAFEDEELLTANKLVDYYSTIKADIRSIVEMTNDFSLADDIVVFCEDEPPYDYVILNKDNWPEYETRIKQFENN